MARITFDDKEATKTSTKPRKNLITYEDINDIKNSVNALYDFVEFTDNEIKIGKWGNEDLYRNKLNLNYNDLTIADGYIQIDLSQLNIKNVFVDYIHSYFKKYVSSGNNSYNKYSPINNIATQKSSMSVMNNFSSQYSAFNDSTNILYISCGSSVTFETLCLVIEYTKE